MSIEHEPTGPSSAEQHQTNLDGEAQLQKLRVETAEQAATPENQDQRAQEAREAIERHTEKPPAPAVEAETPKPQSPLARHLNQHLNYAATVQSLQRQLRPASRAFSKVIHAPAIEKTSEALEKTVARPSVTLGATWTALIVGGGFYVIARTYGYPLSGSELLLSFLVGGIVGIVLEGVWRALRRR